LPATRIRIGAIGNVAIEIFRHGDLRGQRAPALRNFDVFLAKDYFAAVIRDLSDAALPLDLIKWRTAFFAEKSLEFQPTFLLAMRARSASAHLEITGSDTGFQFNHLGASF